MMVNNSTNSNKINSPDPSPQTIEHKKMPRHGVGNPGTGLELAQNKTCTETSTVPLKKKHTDKIH